MFPVQSLGPGILFDGEETKERTSLVDWFILNAANLYYSDYDKVVHTEFILWYKHQVVMQWASHNVRSQNIPHDSLEIILSKMN